MYFRERECVFGFTIHTVFPFSSMEIKVLGEVESDALGYDVGDRLISLRTIFVMSKSYCILSLLSMQNDL